MGMTITLCLGFCSLNNSPCIFKGALALHFLQVTPFGMGGWCSWAVWAACAGVVITPFSSLTHKGRKNAFFACGNFRASRRSTAPLLSVLEFSFSAET